MRWRRSGVLIFAACLILLGGCDRQTPFAKAADKGGAQLAAAATTLTYLHEGKITTRYARSSFINYRQVLKGFDQQLAALSGAPAPAHLKQLLELYQPAAQAVAAPCLSDTCNWRQQVMALQRASDALRQASKG